MTPKEQTVAELKTKVSDRSVDKFLNGITDERKRKDSLAIRDLMAQATKAPPEMWGSSIVGFGRYHYKYASGREGDWPLVSFSPRKQNLTLYIMSGFEGYADLMGRLGKYKTGKACLYIKSLDDVHLPTLKTLIQKSVKYLIKKYPRK
jgi:hypothetical protein